MSKRRHQTSSSRQQLRTKQRGALSRSTIFALMGVACLGLAASQAHRVPGLIEKGHESFVTWTADQGFTIQRVDVTGRKTVPAQFMLQALKIERGSPILKYDIRGAQERLSENPWFKSVNVERRLPNTVFVSVLERVPVARWQVDGKLAVVDAEGVVLTTENLDRYNTLPIIIGQEARHKIIDLFTLMGAEPEIGAQVAAASWIGNRRWDLKLKNGVVVKLPAKDAGVAMSQFAVLEQREQLLARDIKIIDLRVEGRAVFEPTTRANALIERPDFSDAPDNSKKSI